MNWQFWVGTGVFVGTVVTLLYVRHRRPVVGQSSRAARRVLRILARDVGTSQTAYDVWQRANVPYRKLTLILHDLVARGLAEITSHDGDLTKTYALTARGVIASQHGARGQHGRHR